MFHMSQTNNKKNQSGSFVVNAGHIGRRIDNFLLGYLKPIPKSRIYQMVRRGEVRANGGRIRPDYRLRPGDNIRIPPVFDKPGKTLAKPPAYLTEMIKDCIMHEDERFVVVNKPAGLVVHSGTGRSFGVIELLRELYLQKKELHLIHRLDRETSGCLLIAKSRASLLQVNAALKNGGVQKEYKALIQGRLDRKKVIVDTPLQRHGNRYGEGLVKIDEAGKTAVSEFEILKAYRDASYVKVRIATGRTHQIRVHAKSIGHPIAGDKKYGDREFNKKMRGLGLKRMFLHAGKFAMAELKETGEHRFTAPLPPNLDAVLAKLK